MSLFFGELESALTLIKNELGLDKCGFKIEGNKDIQFSFFAHKNGKVKLVKFGVKDKEKTILDHLPEIKELIELQAWE